MNHHSPATIIFFCWLHFDLNNFSVRFTSTNFSTRKKNKWKNPPFIRYNLIIIIFYEFWNSKYKTGRNIHTHTHTHRVRPKSDLQTILLNLHPSWSNVYMAMSMMIVFGGGKPIPDTIFNNLQGSIDWLCQTIFFQCTCVCANVTPLNTFSLLFNMIITLSTMYIFQYSFFFFYICLKNVCVCVLV